MLNEKGHVHLEENSYKQKPQMTKGQEKKEGKKERTRKRVTESEKKKVGKNGLK